MSDVFLLPAQTLLDLCADQPTGARRWSKGVALRVLRVSVISEALAYANIEQIESPSVRRAFKTALDKLLADLVADGGLILGVDDQVARIWQDLIAEEKLTGTPQLSRLVYATAMQHSAAVVEEAQPAHIFLRTAGVTIVEI